MRIVDVRLRYEFQNDLRKAVIDVVNGKENRLEKVKIEYQNLFLKKLINDYPLTTARRIAKNTCNELFEITMSEIQK